MYRFTETCRDDRYPSDGFEIGETSRLSSSLRAAIAAACLGAILSIGVEARAESSSETHPTTSSAASSKTNSEEASNRSGSERATRSSASPNSSSSRGTDSSSRANYAPSYALFGAGATTLIGGAIFGILTQQAKTRLQSARTLSNRRTAAYRGQTFRIVADSLYAVGAICSGLGLYFALDPPMRRTSDTSRARLVPQWMAGGGVGVRLEFSL